MTNYFELYQIPASFQPDTAAVKSKFYELSRKYHPDYAAQSDGLQEEALHMSALNNAAYKTLRNPDATMAYILKLNNLLEDEEKYTLPPMFLMEMMDINEAISDFEADPEHNTDAKNMATNDLNEQLELWDDATGLLTSRYDNGEHTQELLLQIKDQYFRKKYLLRIKERIDRFAAQ